ncbi:SCO family protein [Methylobacterium sp. NEAU K]|uniref:SCO family protein n=1 Tax=Methylobacterium sp. NEAU K TaxID=3064946 RepID=UPI0027330AB7|nr:SCO family protein [Methylobacterium sp. NEAU K]MDP4003556.1 SCO family protein [Methylobacterium sp. NEAU K]
MAPSPLALIASTALVALVATGTGAIVLQQGSRFSHPRRVGGAFAMTDLDGHPVSQADLLGKPTALFFGFTHCPDVCPTTLATLAGALGRMGRDADRLNVVFVTLDPERDTPATLREYLASFDPRIRGFVGTLAQVARMADAYHVAYRRVPTKDGDYTMEHSATVALFDKSGRMVGEIGYGEDEDRALSKLITLALPGQCAPGGGADLWATNGTTNACGPRS